jgi:hypothetical protein
MSDSKSNLTHRFQPGQSGNPSGRPKSRSLSRAYREKLDQLVPGDAEGRPYAQMVADTLVKRAMKGEVSACAELADRCEGRPLQALAISREEEHVDVFGSSAVLLDAQLRSLTPEELRQTAATLLSNDLEAFTLRLMTPRLDGTPSSSTAGRCQTNTVRMQKTESQDARQILNLILKGRLSQDLGAEQRSQFWIECQPVAIGHFGHDNLLPAMPTVSPIRSAAKHIHHPRPHAYGQIPSISISS